MACRFAETAGVTAKNRDGWGAPGAGASFSIASKGLNHPAPPRGRLPPCPELDCIRDRLPAGIIAAAELRAAETGVGADRALIAADVISEEAYLAALTTAEGFLFEPLDKAAREACPLSDDQLIEAATVGILPLRDSGELQFVIAPRALAARTLIMKQRSGSDLAARIRLTSTERMRHFIARHGAEAMANRASHALREARPDLSAGARVGFSSAGACVLAGLAFVLLMAAVAPAPISLICEFVLGCFFLSWSVLRVAASLADCPAAHPRIDIAESGLPTYTIIVALYREAESVKDLIAALRRLDYPKEKLDIKLVLEPDDRETRARLEAMRLPAPFELIIAPGSGPRTKPKALNAALPSARGTFVAVFDAEDRPEPDQLRRVLDAFAAGDNRLACVQASLTIDNTADSWLARMFTAEYAGLFDVFLPSLAARRMPLPLGGSSNHFRTDVLRRVGGWDPYNVTEDADLGMRLARLGYRTDVIASSTYEEAPARLRPWLRQRTRWFKGWVQTWLVHMRAPRTLWRELGPRGFAVFQLLAGGSVLAALLHPLFLLALLRDIATPGSDGTAALSTSLHGGILLLGYLASAWIAVIGLARRNLRHCAWALLLMPVYWLLLSIAAWRALGQLVRHPYRWEKTEHGLARTSRLNQSADSASAAPVWLARPSRHIQRYRRNSSGVR